MYTYRGVLYGGGASDSSIGGGKGDGCRFIEAAHKKLGE